MRLKAMTLLPFLATALFWAGDARAGFSIKIFEDGNMGSATIINQVSGGTISVTGVLAGAPDFNFVGFSATSNANVATTQGTLQGTGTILSQSAGTHTLTIIESDDGYSSPAFPIKRMDSSSGYTFSGGGGNSFTFQSFATAGANLFGTGVPSPGHTYSPLVASGAFNESPVQFTAPSIYTLTQRYDWVSTASGAVFQPTGSTITSQAIPEPSSLTLALIGGGSLGLIAIRRRRRGTQGRGE